VKDKEKRLLRNPRYIWVHNIKMDPRDSLGGRGTDWIGLTQNKEKWRAVVHAVMNLQVP
jgi:hypothetical protein